MPQKLWILTGCTAVGKTALSLDLAKTLDAPILSCDSVQVYRGADIGSAKIPEAEREGILHYGLDLCNPDQTFSVSAYQDYALTIAASLKGNLLVVGGTGFYLKSFFTPVTDAIEVPQEVRTEVEHFYQQQGLAGLQQEVLRYGPVEMNASDWNNPRRLLSVLGKQRVTQQSQKALRQQFLQKNRDPWERFSKKVIVLERPQASLDQRIEQRVEVMFQAGFLEEVASLRETYGDRLCPPLRNAIGYREALQFLEKEGHDLERLKQEIIHATHQLTKKQKTWFRTQIPVDLRLDVSHESFDFRDVIFNKVGL
ncbi:MAG: tRNA (adenosine(37)-N6)-dimethylallyltransferase MiaA [Verrucomicrobiota bacterium]|nr:MAG: tRNA (adenosine(37)-N6)-dimethylallyltransferase MiaA [Verrucomicrobiota bacterium]